MEIKYGLPGRDGLLISPEAKRKIFKEVDRYNPRLLKMKQRNTKHNPFIHFTLLAGFILLGIGYLIVFT